MLDAPRRSRVRATETHGLPVVWFWTVASAFLEEGVSEAGGGVTTSVPPVWWPYTVFVHRETECTTG